MIKGYSLPAVVDQLEKNTANIDTKVSKAGDTMTGDLKVPNLMIDRGNDYSSLRINNSKGSYGLLETTPVHDINLITRNTDGTNRKVWTFSDSGDFNAPAKILGSAVGIAGEIGFGNMGHGAVQYPAETIQLGGSRNLRINFGANERMLLTNAGDLTVDAQMQATYTGSLALSAQKDTKAAFYTEKSTGGSSEYHTFIKQKLTKTGSNADTWNYSMGQLISSSIHAGLYIQGQKHSDSSVKQWAFRTNGTFEVPHGTITIKGKEVYHEGHKPTPAEIGAVNKAGDTINGQLTVNTGLHHAIVLNSQADSSIGNFNNFMTFYAADKGKAQSGWKWRVSDSDSPYGGLKDAAWLDQSGVLKTVGTIYAQTNKQVYHEGHKPTPDEIGAVNRTGDTGMTGTFGEGVNNSIDFKDHSNYTWLRNEVGHWSFQGGTDSDDWTDAWQIASGAPTTLGTNANWINFGQLKSNSTNGTFRGIKVIKYANGMKPGDIHAGHITLKAQSGAHAGAVFNVYDAGEHGTNLVISSGGHTAICGGDGAAGSVVSGSTAEKLSLCSDNEVEIISDTNVWADRHISKFHKSGEFELNSGVKLNTLGSAKQLNVQTAHGYIRIGPANTSYCHFSTDRPNFHFSKELRVDGEIYAGPSYDKRVYHQGFKPTPAEIGTYTKSEADSKFLVKTAVASGTKNNLRAVHVSTGAPSSSSGLDGDVWIQYK